MNWYKISQHDYRVCFNSSNQKKFATEYPDFVTTPEEIKLSKKFTEHLVLLRFKNGWTIQRVENNFDAGIENNCIPVNYFQKDKKYQRHLYSLRNENNVPRANFIAQISKKEPEFFGILEVNYQNVSRQKIDNEEYCKPLLKQFFDYLKGLGMKPKWTEDENQIQKKVEDYNYYKGNITQSLAKDIFDQMSIAPVLRYYGGDSESYAEALKKAYNNGHPIEDIFAYAIVRKEDGLLEDAVQMLAEWANDEFFQSEKMMKIVNEEAPMPEYPTKEMFTKKYKPTPGQLEFQTKDFRKTKMPSFDEQAYNNAVKEYNDAENRRDSIEDELRDETEEWQFVNKCFRKLSEVNK